MFMYTAHSDFLQIINSNPKPDCFCNVWSAGFKFPRQLVECSAFKFDFIYHLSAIEKWLHVFKQFFLAVQNSDSSRSQHLVACENIKIRVYFFTGHKMLRPTG